MTLPSSSHQHRRHITSRRARFLGLGRIEFEDVELDAVGPGNVRLAVSVCALCGSDKRLLNSGSSVVPGHEIAGVVVETGAGASTPLGTRALVYIPVYCQTCSQCGKGQTNRCENFTDLIGWQRDGGFADHVDVPEHCLIHVPDDIPLDVAVLGLDTVGTAAHALRLGLRTQTATPQDIAVLGCGALGLGVISVVKAMGLQAPAAYDPHPGRMQTARNLGARDIADLVTHNQFDVVIEVSGSTQARESAQAIVRPGGVVIVLGESNDPYLMPATPRWRRTDCFTVRSFYFPILEAEDNWDLLRNAGAQLRDLLSVPLQLTDLPKAFDAFVAGDYLKPYILSEENA